MTGPSAPLPRAGEAFAVLRREGLIVAVPQGSPVTSAADLAGRRIGVLRTSVSAVALAAKAFEQTGPAEARAYLVDLSGANAAASVNARNSLAEAAMRS